jgi:hypothetical protein
MRSAEFGMRSWFGYLGIWVFGYLCFGCFCFGADVPFKQVTIDDDPPAKPYYKMVGDLNGDSYLDIIVGGAKGPLVVYLSPDWTRSQIAEQGWDGVNGEVADIDRDGDMDIVMGGTAWFENPGEQRQAWKRIEVDKQKAHDIELADLDLDGRIDIVARDQSAFGANGNWIAIYHQENPQSWRKTIIDCPHGEGLKLGDIDLDGDADVLIGGLWYENPRDSKRRWQQHTYSTDWTEPDSQVEIADINADGRPDIILTPAELKDENYRVCWYAAPPDAKQGDWAEHIIVPSIECVIHSLAVGDLNGDGAVDVAIAEMHQGADPDEVSIHLNIDRGRTWKKQVLSTKGSHDIVVGDFDSDGDLDILGANHAGVHPIELWRNLSN